MAWSINVSILHLEVRDTFSIRNNWLSTCFWPFFISTSVLSVSLSVKKVNLEDGTQVKFDILDTNGGAVFDSWSSRLCYIVHAIIVVYDITEEPSFERAKNWVRKVQEMAIPNIFLALVGNKADLEANRKVKREVVCFKIFHFIKLFSLSFTAAQW